MHFDVWAATINKLQSYLEDKLAALDVVSETSEDMVGEVEEEKDMDEGFLSHNK